MGCVIRFFLSKRNVSQIIVLVIGWRLLPIERLVMVRPFVAL